MYTVSCIDRLLDNLGRLESVCMYFCMHVYMYIYVYRYIYRDTIYLCTCIYTYMSMHICIYIYTYVCTYMQIHLYNIHRYMCVYTPMYTCVCMCHVCVLPHRSKELFWFFSYQNIQLYLNKTKIYLFYLELIFSFLPFFFFAIGFY